MIGSTGFYIFLIGQCQHQNEGNGAVIDVSLSQLSEVNNETESTADEGAETRKFMEEWTRMFFSMGRVERQGEETLIFPGMFSKLDFLQMKESELIILLLFCRHYDRSRYTPGIARFERYRR